MHLVSSHHPDSHFAFPLTLFTLHLLLILNPLLSYHQVCPRWPPQHVGASDGVLLLGSLEDGLPSQSLVDGRVDGSHDTTN